jgi:hypothetical protein
MNDELAGCGRNPCYVRPAKPGAIAMQAFCNCSREKLIARVKEQQATIEHLRAVIEDAGIEISESKEGMSWKRNDELKKQTGRVSR